MSDSPLPPDVVLLRSADEPDPYVQAFADVGLRAVCRPVLQFVFSSDRALRTHLRQRPQYAGLVATSPRAAHALRRVMDEDEGTLHRAWKGAPAYVVGPKTGARFRALGFEVRGEETGDGASLASFIAEQGVPKPLLFLSGNRRRDTLPEGLRAAEVPFKEEVVYETQYRSDLRLPSASSEAWLVFFSPSGLEAVRQSNAGSLAAFRCAAIGPTTAAALRDKGLNVEAVAESPSPEGLVRAIEKAVREDG